MKKFGLILSLLMLCGLGYAVAKKATEKTGLNPPKIEIAELENQIAAAKAAGQVVESGLSARVRELVPQIPGHPGNQKAGTTGNTASPALPTPDDAVWVNTNMTPTPLEQEIAGLEFQFSGGTSGTEPDEITRANLKDRLNELYAQRPENRVRGALDQGNDACPATVINGVPYFDSGTTTGRANNYSPITPCNPTSAPDVIYSFTPQASGSYVVSLCGSSYDSYLYVNTTGACPGTVQIACNDDFCGAGSQVTVNMTAGTTYYIIVDGYLTNSGAYNLALTSNCDVACQSSDIIECSGESLHPSHAALDCDGGCNNDDAGGVNTFGSIAPCQTVCGTAFTFIGPDSFNHRDTDWYRFTLAEDCSVKVTLWTEFAATCYIIQDDNCATTTILHSFNANNLCSATVSQTSCLPAGNYFLWVGPSNFNGVNAFSNYRARLDILPCSGCKIDASITAPGSGAWHTCVGGNDCSIRPSQDWNFCVNIPYESDWTFTTCNDDSLWDSYIYLTTTCCGPVIGLDDDGCGSGLSVISCIHLLPGTYYLLVEGFASSDCGPFTLRVEECLGSCCYGDAVCAYVSQDDCDSLGGAWTSMEPCTTGSCYERPTCSNLLTLFGQEPPLPVEPWNGFQSDYQTPNLRYDDYSVTEPIQHLRFWGFSADHPIIQPCVEDPRAFEIAFFDSIGGTPQLYNATLSGTNVPYAYAGYTMTQYEMDITPPCSILNGWLRVAGTTDSTCDFFWAISNFGNNFSYSQVNSNISVSSNDFAFCLSSICQPIDSVTIFTPSPDTYFMQWYMLQDGFVRVYTSTDPNAVFPATYTVLASGFLPAGPFPGFSFGMPDPQRVFVLTNECGSVPTNRSEIGVMHLENAAK